MKWEEKNELNVENEYPIRKDNTNNNDNNDNSNDKTTTREVHVVG